MFTPKFLRRSETFFTLFFKALVLRQILIFLKNTKFSSENYNNFFKQKGQSSRWQCLGKYLIKLSSEFVIWFRLRDSGNCPPVVPVDLL